MDWKSKMTKRLVIKRSGKVEGIRGLYISPETKRVYVRFSFRGIDKQMTIYPKNMTFSELNRTASKAMTALKRSVIESSVCSRESKGNSCSPIEYGVRVLPDEISKHWSNRGRSEKYINELLRVTRGMALCNHSNRRSVADINKHNQNIASQVINASGLSECQRFRLFNGINLCFTQLISSGRHLGVNPIRDIPKPVYTIGKRNGVLDFDSAAKVILKIRNDTNINDLKRLECELFMRLAVESGQRPKDLYMFNLGMMADGNHCRFRSHKTSREHRVMHLISKPTKDLITQVIISRSGCASYTQKWKNKHGNDEIFESFWRLGYQTYDQYINGVIRGTIDKKLSLYSARHFFITEIFRRTDSEFWAEVFTHEGKSANQRHYLHPDQKKADEILTGFCDTFESIITSLEIANLEDCKPDSFYAPF